MNTIELLEIAAKAAGYKKYHSNYLGRKSFVLYDVITYSEGLQSYVNVEKTKDWNPLENSADALELLIIIGAKLYVDRVNRRIICNDITIMYDETKFGGTCDPETATRKAIVAAAVERVYTDNILLEIRAAKSELNSWPKTMQDAARASPVYYGNIKNDN